MAREVLAAEPNVTPVRCPVTVCGDIHGQFQVRCLRFFLSFFSLFLVHFSPLFLITRSLAHPSLPLLLLLPEPSTAAPPTTSGPPRALPDRRARARHKLPLHGRLRRPGLPLGGDGDAARRAQSAAPRPGDDPARQPRVEADHAGLRLLRRVPAQVRHRQRLEALHGPLRLPAADRDGRRRHLLPPRGALPDPRHARPRPLPGQGPGGAPRGPHVRPAVVGPGRPVRLGDQPSRGKTFFFFFIAPEIFQHLLFLVSLSVSLALFLSFSSLPRQTPISKLATNPKKP